MPELPEAETIRCQLEREIVGALVRRIHVYVRRAARGHRTLQELADLVEGRRIKDVARRGKAILLHLNGQRPSTLIIRLGMTGLLRVVGAREPPDTYAVAALDIAGRRQVRFIDQRQFGSVTARAGHAVDEMPEFARYGPEPLSDDFTPEYLKDALGGRKAGLESLLMNQSIVAGIGKIYADEICFRAGVRPGRAGGKLTRPACHRLWQATREVLSEAIDCRGSSARDETYADVYGVPGRFQDRLCVYQRTGDPCPRCETPIRRIGMTGGRGMHFCPKCQR